MLFRSSQQSRSVFRLKHRKFEHAGWMFPMKFWLRNSCSADVNNLVNFAHLEFKVAIFSVMSSPMKWPFLIKVKPVFSNASKSASRSDISSCSNLLNKRLRINSFRLLEREIFSYLCLEWMVTASWRFSLSSGADIRAKNSEAHAISSLQKRFERRFNLNLEILCFVEQDKHDRTNWKKKWR